MNKKLIATYGTLRLNQGNYNWLLKDAKHLGTTITVPEFELYSLGGFPGVKENGNTSIVVDIFEVNDYEAARVDQLEGYKEGVKPTFYDKIEIDTPYGKAGMYIYMGKVHEENKIQSGDWVQWLNSKYIIGYDPYNK